MRYRVEIYKSMYSRVAAEGMLRGCYKIEISYDGIYLQNTYLVLTSSM